MAFLENREEYMTWGDDTANDQYLSSLDRFMYNTSSTTWNNASGCGYNNAAGVDGRKKGSNYVCDGCPDSGSLCSGPSDTSCPEGCSCKYGGPSMVQRASNKFRNASGCGYSNAAGGPVINVGGDTYDMQPTLAWNQGNFFGQTQGFGAGNLVCEPCPRGFRGTRQACGGTGCYNRLGQRLAEAGTGIPPGMSVQYTQV